MRQVANVSFMAGRRAGPLTRMLRRRVAAGGKFDAVQVTNRSRQAIGLR